MEITQEAPSAVENKPLKPKVWKGLSLSRIVTSTGSGRLAGTSLVLGEWHVLGSGDQHFSPGSE